MVRDAPWRKLGGCDDNDAFARVNNNLLLHEYIYYFTPVHFNLLFALFSTLCLKINITDVLAITRESIVGFS